MAEVLRRYTINYRQIAIRGCLINLGAYPGYVHKPNQVVQGYLVTLRRPFEILHELDTYEGTYHRSPVRSLYNREKLQQRGKEFSIYVYSRKAVFRPKIAGGKFRSTLPFE